MYSKTNYSFNINKGQVRIKKLSEVHHEMEAKKCRQIFLITIGNAKCDKGHGQSDRRKTLNLH